MRHRSTCRRSSAPDCESFGSAYLKSRSSDSFTAALKDFVPPQAVNITNCGSVKINKKDDLGNNLDGAGFTLYKDAGTIGGTREAGTIDTVTTLVHHRGRHVHDHGRAVRHLLGRGDDGPRRLHGGT